MRRTSLPPLNTIMVGIAMIPSCVIHCESSSVLILAIVIWPSYSPASSSRIGATARQGPHQGAQKSTTTGTSDFSTFCSKSASLIAIGLVIRNLLVRDPSAHTYVTVDTLPGYVHIILPHPRQSSDLASMEGMRATTRRI